MGMEVICCPQRRFSVAVNGQTDLPCLSEFRHCQVTSRDGVIVAGFVGDDFHVYKLVGRKWRKLAEKKWRSRLGPNCEMIDEKLIILGGWKYLKSVDVLDLSDLSWSKGPNLPVGMYMDLSIVYRDNLYIVETDISLVYSIPTDKILLETGNWKKVKSLGKLLRRQVFPAAIINENDFKCKQ